jgi:hypothetical protein
VAEAAQEVSVAPDLVVENGNVARRLIGDDDVVLVLMQLVEHPTHRDHVVIRVGREDDDALAGGKLAAPANLGDEGVENRAVERAGLAVPRQQRAQVVLPVIVCVELEH